MTATFNQAVQASTISFMLTTSSGGSVAGTASYNSSTNTATFTPGSGGPGVLDDLYGDGQRRREQQWRRHVIALYWSFTTAASSTLQTGLVAEWQFNEGSGTTTADNTGDGHTGTLSAASPGPPAWSAPMP